jgi:hypothetical protein
MNKKGFHSQLKSFLIELGEKEGYKSYSGDSEPLDIRLRRKRIEYKPDVIWKYRREIYVFEIGFTEDWRAIIGEFTSACLKECSEFFIFRVVESESDIDKEYDLLNNLLSIIWERFKETYWGFRIFTKKDLKDFETAKNLIKRDLRKLNLIKEDELEVQK